MDNLLTRKLEQFAPLSEDDKRLLDATAASSRLVPARTDLICEGQASENVHLILEGIACRYKLLKNGKRQIVAYLLPGDFCDLNVFILEQMDHSIATVSRCRVVDIPRERVLELVSRPEIARAFWWVTLVDEGILREWLLNIGQRRATARIGHLFCELLIRLRVVSLDKGDDYELPLTQSDIGDTLGISFVHVNRCLQTLREMGLLTYKDNYVVITDLERLVAFTEFNPRYLHLGKRTIHWN